MHRLTLLLCGGMVIASLGCDTMAGPYAPAAGQPGSTAIAHDDPRIVAWASAVGELRRGDQDVSDPDLGHAEWGTAQNALGPADAFNDSSPVVSLGDGGAITLTFSQPITNGAGADFAVFENGFASFEPGIKGDFLELAFVEVSSDGEHFFRFPSASLTPADTQVGYLGTLDPTNLHNLAGKYRAGFGTPFDLSDLAGISPLLNLSHVTHVRVEDVVGSIDPRFARRDSTGRIINDPWSTPFETGGFDLDAVGVLHQIPEPTAAALLLAGVAALGSRRPRGRLTPPHQTSAEPCDSGARYSNLFPRRTAAFTLLETLVTAAITLTLLALSLSSLQRVRERGQAAQCSSNLHQLTAANLAYAAEHDGQFVAAQERSNRVRWHGVRSSVETAFDPELGPLAPYLGREGRVKLCPTFRDALGARKSFEEGTGGYGYNAIYIGGTPWDFYTPERLANVPRASRTVMFTDAAFPRVSGLQEYPYCEPWQWVDRRGVPRGRLAASVHFRHSGLANVAWCDGHVSAEPPTLIDSVNLYNGDAKKWNIGWFGPQEDNGYWRP